MNQRILKPTENNFELNLTMIFETDKAAPGARAPSVLHHRAVRILKFSRRIHDRRQKLTHIHYYWRKIRTLNFP